MRKVLNRLTKRTFCNKVFIEQRKMELAKLEQLEDQNTEIQGDKREFLLAMAEAIETLNVNQSQYLNCLLDRDKLASGLQPHIINADWSTLKDEQQIVEAVEQQNKMMELTAWLKTQEGDSIGGAEEASEGQDSVQEEVKEVLL